MPSYYFGNSWLMTNVTFRYSQQHILYQLKFFGTKGLRLLFLEFLSVLLNFVVCVASSPLNMPVLHSTCHLLALLQITIKP
jgi:hypothetical protein